MELFLRDITPAGLSAYVSRQLSAFFPDSRAISAGELQPHVNGALERTRLCFAGIEKKKFRNGDRVMFNYLHPDHYAMFLYLLANTVSRDDRSNPLAFRLYYLNKVLHGLDAFPDIELPEVFQFMHPTGAVLGHAKYGNYFCVYQGCTVGCSEDGAYPAFGDYVVMYAKSSVIGHCRIGSNVVLGAHALVLDTDVPDNKVVLAHGEKPQIRDISTHVLERRFS